MPRTGEGYNRGDAYEERIFRICVGKGITPADYRRGGAGDRADLIFIHGDNHYVLEIKADLSADYGQKMLKWENATWQWCVDDETTAAYTALGILRYLRSRPFVPRRHTIDSRQLTAADKQYDQQTFEESIDIDIRNLFSYYRGKDCYYMQVGGFGFYHLSRDILNLGVPKFDGRLKLRFRAKTIHSNPLWNYAFYAVLKVVTRPTPSPFDIEEKNGRRFPPIIP